MQANPTAVGSVAEIVNTDEYPVDDKDNPARVELIQKYKAELKETCTAPFPILFGLMR
jgi:hypothetical protein